MNYSDESFPLLREFLSYHENILNHSFKTIDEYFFDLRMFFRYLSFPDANFDEISISEINIAFLASIRREQIYDFLTYLSRERKLLPNSRARKLASIKTFFYYIVVIRELLEKNPTDGIKFPHLKKSLPKYLTVEEADQLLTAVHGQFEVRNYAILMIFLCCGLRISSLVGLNITDFREDNIKILGKGNKENILFLNDDTVDALEEYLIERRSIKAIKGHENAMFLSQRKSRISVRAVQFMVDDCLRRAGLDADTYSPHKLRHTAATAMLQQGVDIRTLQEILGHEQLNTTEIYTHVTNSDMKTATRVNPIGRKKRK